MKRWYLLSIALLLVLGIIIFSGCASQPYSNSAGTTIIPSQQEGIWVTGTGKVSVVPDIVNINLGIQAQESNVAVAQEKATNAMNRVMDVLANNGVDKDDIQTQYFNIDQVTRWDDDKRQEIVIGYRVSNMVAVKIRNLDKTGAIIDAVVQTGEDLIRVNSVYFSIDDVTIYYDEAREKAMQDAGTKAKQLAKLGNVSLGKPTYISESGSTPPPIIRGMEAPLAPTADVTTPISPGQMEVVLNVQLVYAIK